MAATIGTDPDLATLRIGWLGGLNETAQRNIQIDGAAADADIEQFFDDLDGYSTAVMSSSSVSAIRLITGLEDTIGVPAEQAMVNNNLSMLFFRGHPDNAGYEITKTVLLPAPKVAARTSSGVPIVASVVGDRSSADENLRGIVDFLEDNLVYVNPVTGVVTAGGWTFDPARSAYIAAPAILGDG